MLEKSSSFIDDKKQNLIAIVENNNKDITDFIYYNEDKNIGKHEYNIVNNSKFSIVYSKYRPERFVHWIFGSNRCGKSYYVRQLLDIYNIVYPKRIIYIISGVDFDISLEDENKEKLNIKRVNLNEKSLNELLNINKIKPCLLLFDDWDGIEDKNIITLIENIIKKLSVQGADHSIDTSKNPDKAQHVDMIITQHHPLQGIKRRAYAEANFITFFPNHSMNSIIETILKKKFMFDNEAYKKAINTESRAVTLHMTYPLYLIDEKRIYLLK